MPFKLEGFISLIFYDIIFLNTFSVIARRAVSVYNLLLFNKHVIVIILIGHGALLL